jgi:hypothetical protein
VQVYGGAISLYLGGYAWSYSSSSSSSSRSGLTTASGVRVSISDVNSSDCSATTAGYYGANSYGGSMSVYIGAYAGSSTQRMSFSLESQSYCGATVVSGFEVSISSSRLANSSAVSRTFSQCPLVYNVPDLTRVPLAEAYDGSFGANVSALGSAPAASYRRCVCNAL